MSDNEVEGEVADGDPWLWAMSEEFDCFQRVGGQASGRMKREVGYRWQCHLKRSFKSRVLPKRVNGSARSSINEATSTAVIPYPR